MAGEKKNVPTANEGPSWLGQTVDDEEVHARLEALDEVTSATEAAIRGLMEQLSLRSESAVHFPRTLQVVDAALERFQRLRTDISQRHAELLREEAVLTAAPRKPRKAKPGPRVSRTPK